MSESRCINLRRKFGKKYKIDWDESRLKRDPDSWLMRIRCQHGHIYPQGGDLLAVSTNKHGQIARRLAALDCTTVLQDGDDGINASFHMDDLKEVARIVKPRRRKRLSEEQKKKAVERLARYRSERKVEDSSRGQGGEERG